MLSTRASVGRLSLRCWERPEPWTSEDPREAPARRGVVAEFFRIDQGDQASPVPVRSWSVAWSYTITRVIQIRRWIISYSVLPLPAELREIPVKHVLT